MGTTLEQDSRYEASINRLKAMGLKFYVERVGNNECFIAIDMKSIAAMIDRKITYPSRRTYLEGDTLVIRFWRYLSRQGGDIVGVNKP